MKKFNRKNKTIRQLLTSTFKFSALLFMIMFVTEYFLPGFVTNWFNPIWLLLISIISVMMLAIND